MPSIINATTSTGLVSSADNSGSLQLATNNGTTAVTIDTSQNVGIGKTPSTGRTLELYRTSESNIVLQNATTGTGGTDGTLLEAGGSDTLLVNYEAGNMRFFTSATERMRILAAGSVVIGKTAVADGASGITLYGGASGSIDLGTTGASGTNQMQFFRGTEGSLTRVGYIQTTGSATTYNSGSDYRLKDDVKPLTNALDALSKLKPCAWNWKVDGSYGEGFIAHELAEVCPQAVSGQKDAVDEEGKPIYQGVDTSMLIGTLTAAIQELKAELDATKAEVQALKGVA